MVKWKHLTSRIIGMIILSLLANCVFAADYIRPKNPNDPFERFNRVMYRFNDIVDKIIFKPVAELYNKIVPTPIVKGISHIYANIDTIPTIANDILQFNFYQATSDTWRFALNSTIGIAGFFDVATPMGLENNYEDLGLTFARWGWTKSTYLVLPFVGPSTFRDGIAWPINYQLFTIYPYIRDVRDRYIVYGIGLVSKRAELLRFQSIMDQAAIDRYAFLRDAYMQRRAYMIDRNQRLGNPYLAKNDQDDDGPVQAGGDLPETHSTNAAVPTPATADTTLANTVTS
jgi:phospholipid-binding lipoprotein MlaA